MNTESQVSDETEAIVEHVIQLRNMLHAYRLSSPDAGTWYLRNQLKRLKSEIGPYLKRMTDDIESSKQTEMDLSGSQREDISN